MALERISCSFPAAAPRPLRAGAGPGWKALAGGVAAIVLAACQSLPPATTVSGTGDPTRDVPALQAAVDRGGVVHLRGTFDLGERERVLLRRDVEVVGLDGATIKGGFFSFYGPLPDARHAAPGPKIAIRNLHFDGALYCPINIGSASELVVSGNRITNLRAYPLPLPGYADGQAVSGIFFGTAWATLPGNKREYLPGAFTGRVLIEDNVIELRPPQPAKTLGYGMMGQWTTGIDATIRRNTITGATRTDIETIDNYRGPAGEGRIRISDNRLTTNEAGIPFPGAQTPNAVLVGYFSDRAASQDPSRFVEHVVENNVIETRGPASMGVAVISNGARVKGNRITAAGEKAVPVMVAASEVEVAGNTVRGRGVAAFSVNGFATFKGARNRLVDNDLREFDRTAVHVMFGKTAEDNVCTGRQSILKVADEGARNRCP